MTDYSGLVERLRSRVVGLNGNTPVEQAMREAAAAIEAQRERIERLEGALREIAAFDDGSASEHLKRTGSYGCFDEPGAVRAARAALEAKS